MRLAAAILGTFFVTTAIAEHGIAVTYQEPLEQLRLTYASSFGEQKLGANVVQTLRFEAFGKRFDIDLDVNRTLLGPAQRELIDARYAIYRGQIAGSSDSWARLVIVDDVPRGMLWDGAEFWAIEVERNKATGLEEAFMFRLSDVQIAPGALACSELSAVKNGGEYARAVLSEVAARATRGPGATSQIDLAVIGDFEFTTDKGGDADASDALITRMNNVDGIFSMQLGVQLNVNRIDTFSSNNDPFTDQLIAETLLDQLTDYRNATPSQFANGLSHLFTGRNLEGNTVGIAYTGALCSREFGAGLTQGTHSVTMDSLIAAHEIGHNFGAPHDGTMGSACEAEPQTFLMAPNLGSSDQFSDCSIEQMQLNVDIAACVTPLANIDVAVVAAGQPANVLLGDTAGVTFDVNNVGTGNASGVSIDVSIPVDVSVNSASATSGSCSNGAGTASCSIGSIAPGSGVTVSVNVTTLAAGVADFVATASATADTNSGNDQATAQLTVDPAVDLVSSVAATSQVVVGQSTTLSPTVENRSSIAATNVSVTVSANAGMRIDSANWPAGTCSIDNGIVTCQAGSLAAQSTTTLQLGVTGVTEGSRSYSMMASAAETDRNTGNNNDSGQLNVIAASTGSAGGSSSSGGGSLGWLSLLLLALAAIKSPSRVSS